MCIVRYKHITAPRLLKVNIVKHLKICSQRQTWLNRVTVNLMFEVKYFPKLLVCKTVRLLKSYTAPLTAFRMSCGADNRLAKPAVISVKLPFWVLLDLCSVQQQQMAYHQGKFITRESVIALGGWLSSCIFIQLHLFLFTADLYELKRKTWNMLKRFFLLVSPSAFM